MEVVLLLSNHRGLLQLRIGFNIATAPNGMGNLCAKIHLCCHFPCFEQCRATDL